VQLARWMKWTQNLAAKQHLVRWLDFIDIHHNELSEIGFEAGINADAPTTLSVARWGFSNAMAFGARSWLSANAYEPIKPVCLELLIEPSICQRQVDQEN